VVLSGYRARANAATHLERKIALKKQTFFLIPTLPGIPIAIGFLIGSPPF